MTLRDAAQAVVDAAEPDDDFEGSFLDYLVPFAAIDRLRAALDAAPPAGLREHDKRMAWLVETADRVVNIVIATGRLEARDAEFRDLRDAMRDILSAAVGMPAAPSCGHPLDAGVLAAAKDVVSTMAALPYVVEPRLPLLASIVRLEAAIAAAYAGEGE